jgi:hypothetical protein
MTNPTSNFGWQMPTPTDLVTDLPADFEVFGQAVDTSMADLKGGTTGQILSKATNTDMDFTWITNDVGDITAVTVTAPITGGGTSGSVGIAISGATTSASGAVQLSDSTSTTSSVLASTPTATKAAYDLATSAYAPAFTNNFYAGKNRLINGNLQIWQRGTSFSSPLGTDYLADRWNCNGGSGGTTTISQQTTGVPIGAQYCIRTAYGAASSYNNKAQILETSTTKSIIGNTVTFQVKLRKNASFASGFNVRISKSATVDAGVAATWTIIQTTSVTNASLPTGTTSADWYTATVTAAIPNDGTANSVKCSVDVVSAGASGEYWEMAQAQLEIGSTATPFQTASGSIGGELALCQRYYFRSGANSGGTTSTFSTYGQGFCASTTEAFIQVYYPSSMRVNPTALEYASIAVADSAGAFYNVVSVAFNQINTESVNLYLYGLTGLTANRPARLANNNNTAGYFAASAEL